MNNNIFVVNQRVSLEDECHAVSGVYDSWNAAKIAMDLLIDYRKKESLNFEVQRIPVNQPLTPWNNHFVIAYP